MDWQDSLRQFLNDNPDLPEGTDASAADTPKPASKGKAPRLDLILDRKGRAGKTATIIAGFPDDNTDDDIDNLAATLKRRLGTGGSSRGREILIQGDRRADIAALLPTLGYRSRNI